MFIFHLVLEFRIIRLKKKKQKDIFSHHKKTIKYWNFKCCWNLSIRNSKFWILPNNNSLKFCKQTGPKEGSELGFEIFVKPELRPFYNYLGSSRSDPNPAQYKSTEREFQDTRYDTVGEDYNLC